MKVKWRNITESSFTGGLSGANENVVTINASATGQTWIDSIAAISCTNADTGASAGDVKFFGGVSLKLCDTTSATTKASCSGSATDVATSVAVTGTCATESTYFDLTGPIVKINAIVDTVVADMSYYIYENICVDAALTIPAWTSDGTKDVDWITGTEYTTFAVADTTLGTSNAPKHNLDTTNHTACTIHFLCDSSNSAACATTATTSINILRSNATLAAGTVVKVNAYIGDSNLHADVGGTGLGRYTSGDFTVNVKPDCA